MKDIYGDDAYNWSRYGEAQSALAASKIDLNPIVGSKGGSSRIYSKGAFVIGMLSHVVGHDEFQRAIKNYLTKFAYANANTNDLYMSFYESLGLNLDWFFDEWLYRGGEPDYHISYGNIISNGKAITEVSIDQVQPLTEYTDYFKMPITVEVHYKDGSMDSKTDMVESSHYVMDIPNTTGKAVDFVLFDPNYTILKTTEFDKSNEEWQAQALRAPNMLDRYEALVAFRTQPMKDKKDVLMKMYHKETFHAMKEEILSQLSADTSIQTWVIFLDAIKDKEASVRMTALQDVPKIPADGKTAFENLLSDSSYTIIQAALEKLCIIFPEKKGAYLRKTDKLYGQDNELRVKWLQLAYVQPADTVVRNADSIKHINSAILKELIDYTSPAFEFRIRTNAFKALQALNYLDDRSAMSMLNASLSWNGRLASPAREALGYFYKQIDKKAIIDQCIAKGKWTDEERNKLSGMFK
jgi:aminopeptidase N